MSFLQNTALLHGRAHAGPAKSPTAQPAGLPALQSRSSIAALVGLVRNPAGAVGDVVDGWLDGLTKAEREQRQCVEDKKHVQYLKMRNAENYGDWKAAATELDVLQGNNKWKQVPESPDYDYRLVEARLKQLDEARFTQNAKRMLFLLRTALARDLGGMGGLKLYKHTHVGTKDLIDRYITSALDTLHALLDISINSSTDELDSKRALEQVLSTRQAFGRSALLLSGGATFGMNHIGVMKTLWENKLLPRIISGASAGSIVCAVLCTRTDEEVPELLAGFCHGDLAVFEQEGNEDTVLGKISRFLKNRALFDISHLTRVMREMLGDLTFQEAYNRTRRILNICVSSASLYELPRLLNYVTAPNVLIWSAVAASCSVPFIFSPATILAKDPKHGGVVPWNPSTQTWIDGSVDNDLPMTRLAEMFNVNHFIVSQVNPHVVPFLAKEEDSIGQEVPNSTASAATGSSWLNSATSLAKSEAIHRMHFLAEMGIFPNTLTKTISVLSQKYSGDITIMPAISYTDFPRMLSNPTVDYMTKAMLCGERATWPKLSRIRNHCAIELALDDAVQKLRTRIVFSSSQADLRLGAYSRISQNRRLGSMDQARGGRRRRKFSHSSELDASVINEIQEDRLRRSRESRHHKARSMNIPSLDDDEAQVAFSREPLVLQTDMAHFLPDILSSGAETSNMFTSNSEDEDNSSSTASPVSPTSPNLLTLWPTSRRLFPHASQPNTPAADHRRPSFGHAGNDGTRPGSPHFSMKALSMSQVKPTTKPAAPSAPEAIYRSLFHSRSRTRNPASVVAPKSPPPENAGVKRFNALGLEIDISGTRGMVLRKKRPD